MIRYGDCTAVIRGLFPLWTMFVELGLITNTVRLFMQRRKAGALTGSILLIACIHVFWQLFNTEIKRLNKPIPG